MGARGMLNGNWSACTVVTTLAWAASGIVMILAWALFDDGNLVTLLANTSLFLAGIALAVGRRGNLDEQDARFKGAYELGREAGDVRHLR